MLDTLLCWEWDSGSAHDEPVMLLPLIDTHPDPFLIILTYTNLVHEGYSLTVKLNQRYIEAEPVAVVLRRLWTAPLAGLWASLLYQVSRNHRLTHT